MSMLRLLRRLLIRCCFTNQEEVPYDLLSSPVVAAKNQWLSSQVDVEFPTAQSLEGRDIYHALSRHTEVSLFQPQACDAPLLQEIYLVDFHRLTVWFALLQATRSSTQHEQERLVEFLPKLFTHRHANYSSDFILANPLRQVW